jgi:hypothetical protein
MNRGSGGLIIAGLIVAVVGWLIQTDLVDQLGKVLVIVGAGVGVFGLIKVMSNRGSSRST